MDKLKVAILEDCKNLLKDLKTNLEATNLVEVVAFAQSSEEFLEKISHNKTDAIILDIDLGGDSMNGLDIANQVKLPVLFVSGKTRDFYQNIENFNINSNYPVEHLTKPVSLEILKKLLPKFIAEIEATNRKQHVYLDFRSSKRNKIDISTISYLCTEKGNGAESNNKVIYFTDRDNEILIDFSFSKMHEKNLSQDTFIQIHQSYRVNKSKIKKYLDSHEVLVEVYKSPGIIESIKLPVSENYRKHVKNILK